MAGMFVGRWAFGRDEVWEVIFGTLMIWFLVHGVQSLLRYGVHLPHSLIHTLMNFAMLLMYWYPMGSSRAGAMSMAGSAAPRLDGGVALALAFTLLLSAVFTLASPIKGASHFGCHVPPWVLAGAPGPEVTTTSPALSVELVVARPWLADLSHVVMCVAMAFMLLLIA